MSNLNRLYDNIDKTTPVSHTVKIFSKIANVIIKATLLLFIIISFLLTDYTAY